MTARHPPEDKHAIDALDAEKRNLAVTKSAKDALARIAKRPAPPPIPAPATLGARDKSWR